MENHLLKNLFLDNGLTPKKIDYLTSLRLGWDELKKKSFKEVSRNSGSELVENGLIKSYLKLKYFDEWYLIFKDDESIYIENKKDIKTSFRAQILILHYLNNSDGEPHAGEWITYRQLKTGPFYYPAFKKRSIEILEKSFNNSPDKLKSSALTYDAERAEFGDMGFVFQVLPRVPVALAFWKGDREFAPEINLLFDSSITHYLPLEDITVVCQELALKLVQKE